MAKIKVLLADSSTFTRILLSNALESLGFNVVAVAKNGVEALEMFAKYLPDITLIDLKLDGAGGIDVVRALTQDNPSAAVALLMPENIDDPDIIIEAVRAGAKAYMKKPTSGEDLKGRLNKLAGKRAE
ncbi:MAG: response regulator [Dehalococcoidales bacterium]|jgi:DNA-binding NarL/FixJ family response regulator